MIEHFPLHHLSASTINDWITNKPNFYNKKVLGKGFVTNPNMCRGKAVEDVVNMWAAGLMPPDAPDATLHAAVLDRYDGHMIPYVNECGGYFKSQDEIRASLPGLVVLAFRHYTTLWQGRKPLSQEKININLPGVELPVIGYLDYRFEGMVRDCKVVGRSAKKLSQNYCIAGAIYKLGTGDEVTYDLFVANKKPVPCHLPLTTEDYQFGLSYAIAAGKIIEKIRQSENTEEVFKLMCGFPNLDEVWDKIEKKDLAQQWGIQVRPSDLEDKE